MADEHAPAIEDYLVEDRKFPPPAGFKEHSLAAGTFLYDEADTDYQGFWARQAADLLTWAKDWDTICDWQLPFAKWFIGGSLNVSYNCLDRHVEAGRGDKVAFHWEGEPGDTRTITYAELCSRGAALRERAQGPRRAEGRPSQHLHADDPRAPDRAARMRADRRTALGRVRRVLT